jgi:hypothetical protein
LWIVAALCVVALTGVTYLIYGKSSGDYSQSNRSLREFADLKDVRAGHKGKIPPVLVFSGADEIIKTHHPKTLHKNIHDTIRHYTKAFERQFNGVKPYVIFLNENHCQSVIQKAQPRLMPYYRIEKLTAFKQDICRMAALYVWGGYYIDASVKVLHPIVFPDTVAIATVFTPPRKDYTQVFIAAKKHHVAVRRALDFMLHHYQGHVTRPIDNLGPKTLKWAFEASQPTELGHHKMLEEVYLDIPSHAKRHPEIKSVIQAGKHACNIAVIDPFDGKHLFYSHTIGSTHCFPKKH